MGDLLANEHEVVARIVRLLGHARPDDAIENLLRPFPAERRELILQWVDEVLSLRDRLEGSVRARRARRR